MYIAVILVRHPKPLMSTQANGELLERLTEEDSPVFVSGAYFEQTYDRYVYGY